MQRRGAILDWVGWDGYRYLWVLSIYCLHSLESFSVKWQDDIRFQSFNWISFNLVIHSRLKLNRFSFHVLRTLIKRSHFKHRNRNIFFMGFCPKCIAKLFENIVLICPIIHLCVLQLHLPFLTFALSYLSLFQLSPFPTFIFSLW